MSANSLSSLIMEKGDDSKTARGFVCAREQNILQWQIIHACQLVGRAPDAARAQEWWGRGPVARSGAAIGHG